MTVLVASTEADAGKRAVGLTDADVGGMLEAGDPTDLTGHHTARP